jgi:hypothetical protein
MTQPPVSGQPHYSGMPRPGQVPVSGQPASPTGFAPQTGYVSTQEPKARSSKPILVGGLVVIVLAAIGIAAVLMFGFDSSPSESPSEVTTKYMDEILDADLVGALDYRCQADIDDKYDEWGGKTPPADRQKTAEADAKDMSFQPIDDEKIDGDTATVRVEAEIDYPMIIEWSLIQEDNEWKICGGPKELPVEE